MFRGHLRSHILGSLKSRRGTAYYCIIMWALELEISKERSEHLRFRELHCHSAPAVWEPLQIFAQTLYFCAQQRICYRPSVRPSVCLSVTRVDQSKTVEVRNMQLSPPGSPMTLVSSWLISPRNSKGNIGSEGAESERVCLLYTSPSPRD